VRDLFEHLPEVLFDILPEGFKLFLQRNILDCIVYGRDNVDIFNGFKSKLTIGGRDGSVVPSRSLPLHPGRHRP